MKLIMTMMVRDEADVIRAALEHHRAQGIDRMIVTDNGSVDGTLEILQQYEAEGFVDPKNEPPRPRVSPDDHRDPPPRGRDQKFFRCAPEGRGHGEYLPRVDDARKRQTHPKGQKKERGLTAPSSSTRFSLRRKAEGRPRCGCGTRA